MGATLKTNIKHLDFRFAWHRWRNQLWNGAMRCQALLGVKFPKVGAIFTRTFVNGRTILLWNCVNHSFFLLNAPFFMKNSFFQRRKPVIATGRAGFLASYGLGHREGHWWRQGQRPGLTVASAWNRGDIMGIPHFWGLYHPFVVMNGDSLWHWVYPQWGYYGDIELWDISIFSRQILILSIELWSMLNSYVKIP